MFHAKGSELRITSTRLPAFICTSPWCLCKDTCLSLIQTLQFYKSHRTLFSARSYMHHMGCEAGYRFSQCISAKELWSLPQFCSLLRIHIWIPTLTRRGSAQSFPIQEWGAESKPLGPLQRDLIHLGNAFLGAFKNPTSGVRSPLCHPF